MNQTKQAISLDMYSPSKRIDDGIKPYTPASQYEDIDRINRQTNNITAESVSPSPNERTYQKSSVSSPSISLSRRKKEVAEERLISLFSAATKSFDSKTNSPGSLVGHINSMSSDESSERPDDFKVSARKIHQRPSDLNQTKVMRPIPRRPNVHSRGNPVDVLFSDIANLEALHASRRGHRTDDLDKYQSANTHYSQQMNIQVMDNFFVFQV